MTKEEIKNKIASDNNFDSFERAIRYTFNRELLHSEKEFIDKLIDEAMQEYSDQKNVRLKAVVSKYEEIIKSIKEEREYVSKWHIIAKTPKEAREYLKIVEVTRQLESELSKLKAE